MTIYCEACRYWLAENKNQGVCRWRPTYVTRDRHDWCGQFSAVTDRVVPDVADIARAVVEEARRLSGGGGT